MPGGHEGEPVAPRRRRSRGTPALRIEELARSPWRSRCTAGSVLEFRYEGLCAGPDGEIKSIVVDRLRENSFTNDHEIKVDVKQAAGDDAWDPRGVADVSDQLQIR